MYESNLLLYFLCVILTAVAVERFTEVLTSGSIFSGLRAFIFNKAFPDQAPKQDEIIPRFRLVRLLRLIVRRVLNIIRFIIGERIIKLFWTFLYKITSCAYCLSGQVSVVFSLFLPGELFGRTVTENWLIKIGLLWGVSNYIHTIYETYRRGRVITHDYKVTHIIDLVDFDAKNSDSDPTPVTPPAFTLE